MMLFTRYFQNNHLQPLVVDYGSTLIAVFLVYNSYGSFGLHGKLLLTQ